jgi:hypothetical protein
MVGHYNRHAHSLPDLGIAIQNCDTRQWDIYGEVVDVGPYHKYYVKLPSGQVLTWNGDLCVVACLHSYHMCQLCPLLNLLHLCLSRLKSITIPSQTKSRMVAGVVHGSRGSAW